MLEHTVNTNNRIKVNYIDPLNSGWEELRGHYLNRIAKFWTLELKTGAQIIAESGGQITREDVINLAKMNAGKFNNPVFPVNMAPNGNYGYVNSDGPIGFLYYFESWKFPVLKAVWEDWEVMKYREIVDANTNARLEYSPVDYNYKDQSNGIPYKENGTDKKQRIINSNIHYYRQCTWVIGTDCVYDNGPVKFCPRDPRDVRFALCPIKIYRANGAPYSQRIKSLAAISQNAWNALQNEIAKAKPHGVAIDVKTMDNITSLDGVKKVTRKHILELYNQDGTILYSSAPATDAEGRVVAREPIKPIDNVDIAAFQRWIDIINFCSQRMQQEGGIYDFQGKPTEDLSVFQSKLAAKASNEALAQAIDAIAKIVEECAIDTCAKLQLMVQNGVYEQYLSAIGASILRPVPIDKEITQFTYAIRTEAKLTAAQRTELKQVIAQAYQAATNPQQGSPYLADLLMINDMIDNDVNIKIISLVAAYLQKKNLQQMQEQQQQTAQANAQSQAQVLQQQTQQKLQMEQQLSQMRMAENDHETENQLKVIAAQSQNRTQNQIDVASHKSALKQNEMVTEKQLETVE